MDADLVAEIERICRIYSERGLFSFMYECDVSWRRTYDGRRRSPLFALSSPDGTTRRRRDGRQLGCPFSIRRSRVGYGPPLCAWTDAWTDAIVSDVWIPSSPIAFRPESLLAIARWQQTFRNYFAGRRQAQLQCRPRRLRAMLRSGHWK